MNVTIAPRFCCCWPGIKRENKKVDAQQQANGKEAKKLNIKEKPGENVTTDGAPLTVEEAQAVKELRHANHPHPPL